MPVRDVDDRHAPRGQPPDRREELVDLAGGERRGRLVHDQQPRVAVESALATSTICCCAMPRPRTGAAGSMRTPSSSSSSRAPRARARPRSTKPKRVRGSRAQEDVLGRAELRHQVELLVDDADAERLRVRAGPRSRRARPSSAISPASLPMRPAEDLHQRGLARAVLAEQDVDLARRDLEVDAVERHHAGEGLADPAHAQRRPGGSRH